MPNHASATLIGHLGRDPETRKAQSGTMVFSAKLAVNTGYGANKRTTWWKVSVFGKSAETLEGFNLTKGNAIGFAGEPSIREYADKDGNTRQSLELVARDFILLGAKDDAPPKAQKQAPEKVSEDAPFDDEIPF